MMKELFHDFQTDVYKIARYSYYADFRNGNAGNANHVSLHFETNNQSDRRKMKRGDKCKIG